MCQVCDLVLGKVPESQVMTDVGAELSFILPSTATHHFPALFDTLEGQTCLLHAVLTRRYVHFVVSGIISGITLDQVH